ncbi:probable cytochrome P450 28d1 [Sitophilus oryzae]|uniref:Probable cytochrome P450 28d1 n=1 Tax=Sitophilus oryzae TaxID=7048 RepID=A0A6J2XS63_SITOR|nr:probable cytochrome P450 28d1 [Sitophilus oryzae]
MYLLVFAVVFLIVFYVWYKGSYWHRRGVPGPRGWPIVGNIIEHFLGKKTLGQVYLDIYRKYEDYPFVGIFKANTPCLLVRDPELSHRILVKDFKFFQNNEIQVNKEVDVLFGHNPFVLRGKEWKDTRQMLTPGLTSGRLKHIFPLISNVAKRFVEYIENHPTATTDGIETRLLTKRFTLDNVAKTAFGIDGKAFDSYDKLSDFMELADSFLTPGSSHAIILQLGQVFPSLLNMFSIKIISQNVEDKIIAIISDVKKYRETHNDVYKDYLQFLIDLAKEHKFTDTDVTAHASTFFLDGYFTSSLILTFNLLCLAQNPEYQQKIREEIKETEEKNKGEIPYEALPEMVWLDACFYESFRKYPMIEMLMKLCTEPYEYTCEDPDLKNMTMKFKKGDHIIIPYGMLCQDPKYFKDPEKYYPERMMEKDGALNKLFFPFGNGPRICIGQRLGILQIKLGLVYLIKNFEITTSPKLQQPISYCAFNFMNEVQGGVWLKYKKI